MTAVAGHHGEPQCAGDAGDPQVGVGDQVARRLQPGLEGAEKLRAAPADGHHPQGRQELIDEGFVGRRVGDFAAPK